MAANKIRAQRDANDRVTALPRKRGSSDTGTEIVWGLFLPPVVTYHPRTILASKNTGTELTFQFVSTDDQSLSQAHVLPLSDKNAVFSELPNLIPTQAQIDANPSLNVGVLMFNSGERPRSMDVGAWNRLVADANDPTYQPAPPPEKWPRGAEAATINRLAALARFFAGHAPAGVRDAAFAQNLAELEGIESRL